MRWERKDLLETWSAAYTSSKPQRGKDYSPCVQSAPVFVSSRRHQWNLTGWRVSQSAWGNVSHQSRGQPFLLPRRWNGVGVGPRISNPFSKIEVGWWDCFMSLILRSCNLRPVLQICACASAFTWGRWGLLILKLGSGWWRLYQLGGSTTFTVTAIRRP